ncbi:MAG: hypothetical protein K1Y01_06870 [Vicinamibacteria bacterium]|nr:hypothetical protein [Vicinamibacteria bacterium]
MTPQALLARIVLLFLALQGLALSAAAQSVSILKDIQATSLPLWGPSYLGSTNGVVIFAMESVAGTEPWRTDGTPEGTRMLRDIAPGPATSNPTGSGATMGGRVFFLAGAAPAVRTLWATDGSEQGTYQVSSTDFFAEARTCASDTWVAVLSTTRLGPLLWATDGTAAGTRSVVSLGTSYSTGVWECKALGSKILFVTGGSGGTHLWVSDGTAAGTFVIAAGAGKLILMGDHMYFLTRDSLGNRTLWGSDGTTLGTLPIRSWPAFPNPDYPPMELATTGDVLVFSAPSGAGAELWISDGTAGGTTQIKDIWPGAPSSSPHGLASAQGRVFFLAGDPTIGVEPWVTDGTAAGTRSFGDLNPKDYYLPSDMLPVAVGEDAYFPTGRTEQGKPTTLFRLEGTTGRTTQTTSFVYQRSSTATYPKIFPEGVDGAALVVGDTVGADIGLWRTDMTPSGTWKLTPAKGDGGSSPTAWVSSGGLTYFLTGVGGALWSTDGTPDGTHEVMRALSPDLPLLPGVDIGGSLLFLRKTSQYDRELWRANAGHAELVSLIPRVGFEHPDELYRSVGLAYFFVGRWLWRSDGTAGGTFAIRDLGSSYQPTAGVGSVGATFYFSSNAVNGSELWRSDGSSAGTYLVADIAPGTASSDPRSLTEHAGKLFFVADDGVNGPELWTSDGTAAGTRMVRVVVPSGVSTGPAQLTSVGSSLFFVADDGVSGTELWRTDGTDAGTTRVADIKAGSASSSPGSLTNVSGRLFFAADDGISGRELWTSNGTTAGTSLVEDIFPGLTGSDPSDLAGVSGFLVFTARGGTASGQELWLSNGTAAGSYMLQDLNPGPPSAFYASSNSNSRAIFGVGSLAFFSPDVPALRYEPWVIRFDQPAVNKLQVSGLSFRSAEFTATVGPGAPATTVGFVVARTDFWPTRASPGVRVYIGALSGQTLSGTGLDLMPGRSYVVRAFAAGWFGESYSAPVLFETPSAVWIDDTAVVEGSGDSPVMSFRVNLARASAEPTSVAALIEGGTAVDGQDFVGGTQVVVIPPGATSARLDVAILADALPEDNETLTVRITGVTPSTGWMPDPATGAIVDDDGGNQPPQISIFDARGPEGVATGTLNFEASLSRAVAFPVSFKAATLPGTALAPGDFTMIGATHVFVPGETRLRVAVPIRGDTVAEPNETLSLVISDPTAATLGRSVAQGVILNDDGPTLSVTNARVVEGSGGGLTNMVFTIVTSQTSPTPITVSYATADMDAEAPSDYAAKAGTAVLLPSAASVAVAVPVVRDGVPEPDESFGLWLTGAVGATIFQDLGVGTILADDGLLVSVSDQTASEGDSGTRPVSFRVTLNQPSASTVSVDWATADGTAVAPFDYGSASGTVTFNSGETSKTITVQIVGDSLEEPYETFFVNLSNPTGGASIGDGQGQGTITNTDGTTDRSRLMFHNFVTNRLYRWHMKNGNTLDTYNWVTPWATDPGWTVGAVADFDQDGQLDYLWHNVNAGDGRLLLWYIDGDNLKGYQFLPYTMLPPWRVATTFDGNGDGAVDIVYYNSTTGVVQVKTHDNAVLLSTYNLNTTLPGNLTRRVVAAVDANGDGDDELALYNSATGQIQAWDVSGSTVTGTITYPTSQSTAQAFTLVSTKTDFNDDGRPDLLWHNPTPTGVFSVWFMTGTTRDAVGQFLPFTATDPVWRVVGSANVW